MIALPVMTRDQSVALFRMAGDTYALEPIQTVEIVGRNLALLARWMLERDLADRSVVVLAGRGRKGAAGLAAARHLLNWGAWVQIVLTHPESAYDGVAGRQLQTLQAMEQAVAWAEEGWELPAADLLLDALVGTGLRGRPAGAVNGLIRLANSSMAPILSLDLPSGLDPDGGPPGGPSIQAAATLAPFLPTAGLVAPAARAAAGQLYLCDAGIPAQILLGLGLQPLPALFAHGIILPVQLTGDGPHVVTGDELWRIDEQRLEIRDWE